MHVCTACSGNKFQLFRGGKPVLQHADGPEGDTSRCNPSLPRVMSLAQRCETQAV